MKSSRLSLPASICFSFASHSPVSSGEVSAWMPDAAQKRDEGEPLGGGDQLAAVSRHVILRDQALDDGRARGGRAETLLAHGRAQFLIIDEFARAFHGGEQGRFGVARRRLGFDRLDLDGLGLGVLAAADDDQRLVGIFPSASRP